MDFSPSLLGWHAPEIPLGAGVVVALWLVWRCWRRAPFPGRASFIGMQLAAVWWTSAAAVENHVISPEAKLFWAKMAWIGIASAPGLWALFVWSYTQGGARRGWHRSLAAFALASWAVALTNDVHHLMYLSAVPATADAGAPLVYRHGAYFYMATTAIYVQMMASLVIVMMAVTRAPAAYRSHYLGFLAAMLIPWMANAGYLTGTLTLFGFDGTPFALIVMGCVFHWLVQRRRLFELVPVARGVLLDVSPDPVLVIDGEGMIVEANPAARDLVGDVASPVGQPLGALPFLERALAPLLAPAADGAGALEEDVHIGSTGRHYEVRRVPLALAGRPAGQLFLFRDITHRKLAEERLEASVTALAAARERAESLLAAEQAARRELNQFLSMAAHEFKTPLAVIDSAAQMLLFKAERTAPEFLPRLETIRQAVRRQVAVIETCLADERLNDEGLRLREEPVALLELLENAVVFHRLHAPDHDIVLTSDPGPLPVLLGDPALLAMAVDNLLSNALKYSPAGTTVALHCGHGEDAVHITVRDSGVGIAEDEVGRIFDRYFRASNAGAASGSGVGLNVVRRIARLHGGDVRVTSTLGLGSSFTLLLPVALAEAA